MLPVGIVRTLGVDRSPEEMESQLYADTLQAITPDWSPVISQPHLHLGPSGWLSLLKMILQRRQRGLRAVLCPSTITESPNQCLEQLALLVFLVLEQAGFRSQTVSDRSR